MGGVEVDDDKIWPRPKPAAKPRPYRGDKSGATSAADLLKKFDQALDEENVAAEGEVAEEETKRSPAKVVDGLKRFRQALGQLGSEDNGAAEGEVEQEENKESPNEGDAKNAPSGVGTTLKIGNLRKSCRLDEFLETLEMTGYMEMLDFVYMPMDLRSAKTEDELLNFSHAIVNFASEDVAEVFLSTFHDSPETIFEGTGDVTYWDVQGLDALVNKFRNIDAMHESMPSSCQPQLFKDGERIEFPAPTRLLKPSQFNIAKRRKLSDDN